MITAYIHSKPIYHKQWIFPGGEVGIKFDPIFGSLNEDRSSPFLVVAKIKHHGELVELAMVVDALRRMEPEREIDLILPYIPYGRQDRVCMPGEPLALKVFADILNSLSFRKVTTYDPHSDVSTALIDRLRAIPVNEIVTRFPELMEEIENGAVLVAPDAGANKKIFRLASFLERYDFVRADKKRDTATGAITGTTVYAEDLTGKTALIVDDICDGGRTFVELAKALKEKNAARILLYVTHGIFSRGLKPLFEAGIERVFSTDSWGGDFCSNPPKAVCLIIPTWL